MSEQGRQELDRAYKVLEHEVPDWVSRMIRWLRDPKSRWLRIPIGILLVLQSVFWFLPVLGIEFLPLGLLLIAEDVPFLRKPVGRMMLWLECKWVVLRKWWQSRRS